MAETLTFFADGVMEATVRHGVARLTLAVQDGSGKPAPTGLLVVPLAQLPTFAGSITRLLREVQEGGEPITVTSRGKPIATVSTAADKPKRKQAAVFAY